MRSAGQSHHRPPHLRPGTLRGATALPGRPPASPALLSGSQAPLGEPPLAHPGTNVLWPQQPENPVSLSPTLRGDSALRTLGRWRLGACVLLCHWLAYFRIFTFPFNYFQVFAFALSVRKLVVRKQMFNSPDAYTTVSGSVVNRERGPQVQGRSRRLRPGGAGLHLQSRLHTGFLTALPFEPRSSSLATVWDPPLQFPGICVLEAEGT